MTEQERFELPKSLLDLRSLLLHTKLSAIEFSDAITLLDQVEIDWQAAQQKEGFMLVPTANVHTFYQDDDEPENCCNNESEFDLLGDGLDDGNIMVVNKITSAQLPSEKFYGTWVVDASKRKFELFVSYAEAAQAIKAAQENN